jgi:hypothetical protein
MNGNIDNLCKRPWGWEGYIYWDDENPPTEFRFSQEEQPTEEQLNTIVQYHIDRFQTIADAESNPPELTEEELQASRDELQAQLDEVQAKIDIIDTKITVIRKPPDPIKNPIGLIEDIKVGK